LIGSSEDTVRAQLPAVEDIVKTCVVEFHDSTKLTFVLIVPVLHQTAVKLYIEDFGVDVALRRYEAIVKSLTSDGTIREDQFKNFHWPKVPNHEADNVQKFDALLWKLARDLVGQGFLKEAIALAFFNVATTASTKMDGLLAAGFVLTVLKELRAGVYTPPPEIHPEPPSSADEVTRILFRQMCDLAYKYKEHSGLEWQHILPGMQRACAVNCIRYRGRDGALALFRDQIEKLIPTIDQCPVNPPQRLPLTPLHITNMAKFDDLLQEYQRSIVEKNGVHPVYVSIALSSLAFDLTTKHYDVTFFLSILSSCCKDIESGEYDFVRKTH
jgi:hypothetical protein